jgi:cardiolipin synthase A/B
MRLYVLRRKSTGATNKPAASPQKVRKPSAQRRRDGHVTPLQAASLHGSPRHAIPLETPWRFKSSHPHLPLRRRWGPLLAGVAISFGAVFYVLARRVFGLVERPSWPPGAGAVTAAAAQKAVEEFAARADRRPSSVGVPYAWSTAATIDPWPEGENFFPRIFDDVRAARSSIHVLMFGWREGEVGTAFADLLLQKLEEGVEVRAVVDAQGSRVFGPAAPMFTRLADAGAQIAVNGLLPSHRDGVYPGSSTQFDWRRHELGRVDHRKLYVIDGEVAWTGGAGIEDHFRNGKFHDVMVRVTGDVVRQAQALFLISLASHGGRLPRDLDGYFPEQAQAGTIPIALLQVVPGGFQSATQAVRTLIDGANTRLDVMNPYVTDGGIVGRLAAAARRGVAVRVVVAETSNNKQATAVFKHHYGELLGAGVRIYEYPGAVVHAKLVIADDTTLFGTLNLDAWALYRNFEVAMMARDPDTAALFAERVFEPDIGRSRPAAAETDRRTRLKNRLASRLAYFI